MTSTCDHCAGPAIHWQRYSGAHLCSRHVRESVEKRVRREMTLQASVRRGARLLVAYSGGKDSSVALHLMRDLRAHRPDLELVALTVDEGIAGYRPPALALTAETCRDLGIEHVVRRTADAAGLTVDAFHAQSNELAPCSFCGVFRRRIMNDVAKEVGASFLVTGHNLDDMAQSVLMNLATDNLDKLAKLGPHDEPKEGLVPRLLPLRTIPEAEVYLYARLRGLRWHDEECPYAARAARQVYREALYRMEESRPGTRHALLNVQDELRPLLAARNGHEPMRACPRCGQPTSGALCKACEFRQRFAPASPQRLNSGPA